jgi:hypothetical protein
MIDHLLQVEVRHKTGKSDYSLMIRPRQRRQLLYGYDLYRDTILPRQLPDLGDGVAGGIPLQKYLINGTAGPDGLDQRLTTDN